MVRLSSATFVLSLLLSLLSPRPAAASLEDSALLDPQESVIGFTVYAQMLFKVKEEGRFRQFSGQVGYDPDRPADTHVDLTVYTATVDMHNAEHDAMLKSPGFFDVERFPTMRFVGASTAVRPNGGLDVTGDLTIRGITRRVTVPVVISQVPGRNAGSRFETTFQIDRTDFGLNGPAKMAGLSVSIAKNVRIHLALALRSLVGPAGR